MKKVALIATALAGCTVGPDYRPPAAAVPQDYLEQDNSAAGPTAAELARWWRSFNDPELSSLIERAVALNLDVQTAAARIREARSREIVAGAAALPQVDAQASATRQRISENAIPIPPGTGLGGGSGSPGAFGLPGTEFNTFRVGLDASWEIDLFGATRRGIEAASARTGSAIWSRPTFRRRPLPRSPTPISPCARFRSASPMRSATWPASPASNDWSARATVAG